jgi:hypothetical protein
VDRCINLEGIVAELFFCVLPNPVSENNEWPEMPVERSEIGNGILSGEIEKLAMGMTVHTIYHGHII